MDCEDRKQELKRGDTASAFWHRENMPALLDRDAAWERGDWDATWYCIKCYMRYYDCSYEEVLEILSFVERAEKKAKRGHREA